MDRKHQANAMKSLQNIVRKHIEDNHIGDSSDVKSAVETLMNANKDDLSELQTDIEQQLVLGLMPPSNMPN